MLPRRVLSLRSSRQVSWSWWFSFAAKLLFLPSKYGCKCKLPPSEWMVMICQLLSCVFISAITGARLSYSQVLPQWESNRIWGRQVILSIVWDQCVVLIVAWLACVASDMWTWLSVLFVAATFAIQVSTWEHDLLVSLPIIILCKRLKSIIAGLLTQLSLGWRRRLDPLPWHLQLWRRQLLLFLVCLAN